MTAIFFVLYLALVVYLVTATLVFVAWVAIRLWHWWKGTRRPGVWL